MPEGQTEYPRAINFVLERIPEGKRRFVEHSAFSYLIVSFSYGENLFDVQDGEVLDTECRDAAGGFLKQHPDSHTAKMIMEKGLDAALRHHLSLLNEINQE